MFFHSNLCFKKTGHAIVSTRMGPRKQMLQWDVGAVLLNIGTPQVTMRTSSLVTCGPQESQVPRLKWNCSTFISGKLVWYACGMKYIGECNKKYVGKSNT